MVIILDDGAHKPTGRHECVRFQGCRAGCADARHRRRYPAVLAGNDDLFDGAGGFSAGLIIPANTMLN